MFYREIMKVGRHVLSLPGSLRNDGWFVYAVPAERTPAALELWWVNHETEEAVEYARLGDLVEPTKFPYSMHEDQARGKELCDARFWVDA